MELHTELLFLGEAGNGFHEVSSTPSGYWHYRSYTGYIQRGPYEEGTDLVVDGFSAISRANRRVTVRVSQNRRHGGTVFTEAWEARDFCDQRNKSRQQGE